VAEIQKPPIEERSFRKSYLIFAGLLAATTLWAAVDETWVRRPWKDYQSEFNRREEKQIRQLIAKEESTLVAQDARLASSKPAETIEAMERHAKELRSGLGSGEFKELQGKLAKVEDDLLDVEREFQFAKAIYDEVYYEWKEQEYHSHDFSKGKAEWEELGAKMAALQPVIDSITGVRDSVKHEIGRRQKELSDVEGSLDDRRKNLIEFERRLDGARSRTVEIKQIILRDYEPNEFNQPIMRVDRCMTCHMGIDRAGFEDWPQPYSTHPRRKAIFGTHPVEQFACTPCHDGQGPGLTVEAAHGQLHHWDAPMLTGGDIDAGCQKCHFNRAQLGQLVTEKQAEERGLKPEDVPYHPSKLMRGQEMIRESQCYACHEIAGYENMPKKGPQLNALSAKAKPEWTYDWLKNPTRFRPSTRMPNPLLPDSEAVAITAFLYRLAESATYEPIVANVPGGNPSRGGQLMAQIGCFGCHASEAMYQTGDPALKLIAEERKTERWVHGPDLSRIGSKTNPAWILDWLKNPRHYWFSTRMPSLRLTDQEAGDVTAFLMTHKDNELERAKIPAGADLKSDELVKMGEYWIRTYGCYGCHDIKGFENAGKVSVSLSEFGNKKVDELFFGDAVTQVANTWEAWTEGKLTFSRRYATELVVQRMPDFKFSDAQADTIALALKSWDGRKVTPQYSEPDNKWTEVRQQGRILAEFYNCAGCHILEGQGGDIRKVIGEPGLSPPNLNTEGRKVQSDWLVEFLSGPTPIRPWLTVRMPTFHFSDAHLNSVFDYFQALEEYDETFHLVDVSQYSDKTISDGKKLFDDYRCLSCHVLENKNVTPEEAANLAPNLRLAHSRLRPDWVIDWLRDPQVIDPGTRMPSFFYSEGQRLYEDADSQMVALRNYLMTLGAPRP
jgi:mono/diheme cytochrome c family protein